MKSDTRYSQFVKKKTKSGKLRDSGKYRHFVITQSTLSCVNCSSGGEYTIMKTLF